MKPYETVMRECGLKMTRQRALVFDVLAMADTPLDAAEIYESLIKSKINLSTVYRILELFASEGIVLKYVLSPNNTSTYELNRHEHKHHLICVKCHSIKAISGCPLKDYVISLSVESHYQILDHKLEILGVCPKCQTNS